VSRARTGEGPGESGGGRVPGGAAAAGGGVGAAEIAPGAPARRCIGAHGSRTGLVPDRASYRSSEESIEGSASSCDRNRVGRGGVDIDAAAGRFDVVAALEIQARSIGVHEPE